MAWIPAKPPTKQPIMINPAVLLETPPLMKYSMDSGNMLYRAENICAQESVADKRPGYKWEILP
jgi:hypothetical protein